MNARTTIPTSATPDVCTYVLKVDGEEVSSQIQVRSITVNREVNRIPWASIKLEDGEAAKTTFSVSESPTFAPGREIEIQLGYRSVNQTVFKGRVMRQRISARRNGSCLEVTCYADAVKATVASRNRYFADMKDSNVIEEILGTYGFANDVEVTGPQLKEVVQFDCSDWDFIICRAEANGQIVIVEDDTIKVAKPTFSGEPALQLGFGATVLELDAEMDARSQGKSLKAISWKAADQALVEAEAQEPVLPEAGNVSAADLASAMGDPEWELRHGGSLDEAQLQAWADARLLRMRLGRLRGRARCQGFAGVKPGKLIEINGVGERFAGKLFVSGVRHSMSAGNWETDVQFGLPPGLHSESFRLRAPEAGGLLPGTTGLQIGVVTALEGDPDGEHRIKCRLPLVSIDEEGSWARLATLDAGDGRGTYFRPEIGDEVIVGFLCEDPRQPVVLGMFHSSAKPAPETATDDNHLKGYVTREKLKLVFDDEKKLITAETPAGNRIELSEDASGITISDQNGNRIVMDDNGITINSSKDITLTAKKDIKAESTNAKLTAKTGLKLAGNGTAELSGAQVKVSGDAMTVIKGGLVQIN